ncbi:MAG: glycoside hydrolase family 65 protein [Rhodococcus sp. (in: high G+C Gram-positive bacteria)]|uniref:glycoside hydrolase family 65 protein n=1 Tax=Rhodococcus sp. TaxID=1831 RepID=UPI003BAE4CA4
MMMDGKGYEIAPWHLRWRGLDLEALHATESTFALSNGHIGIRGTFEEGEPRGLPGTYLNGFYEQRPLPYAEAGYGYPEDGQTIVNVTNGSIMRLLVEDEPLDMRYGTAPQHERILDFRSGTLRRTTDWTSPTGRKVRIHAERLVSFTSRAVAAIRYEVEPLDGDVELVLQSDLLANEPNPIRSDDPRVAAALDNPLVSDFACAHDYRAVLAHHTRASGLRMAAGMDHELDLPAEGRCSIETESDLARLTVAVDVPAGQRLRVTKYLAYGWSTRRSTPALRGQVEAALAGALETGWDTLLARQRDYLDNFWEAADVEIDGDVELQQAVRFALFHVLQASARGESRAIPAKGLTGPGYDGHAFWDTEAYVLPLLTYTVPDAARDALRWRHSTLDKAKIRAGQLGQSGAVFPWRSINGQECSGYWPAGTAAFHVGADVASATARYLAATGDEEFETHCGVELLVETARLWSRLGHHNSRGEFRIDGVTGPDEYTAVADNNLFTNLMAQQNLQEAAAACERRPAVARDLGVDDEETARWRDAAAHMRIPFDEGLGVHQQSDGFTHHDEWDFENTPPEKYPLLLNYPYFDLYRKQVVKQADLVLAMYLRGDAFTPEQKAANFAYYEARTVRDSSLSACVQAVIAAEVGHLQLAYDYFAESALTDIHDVHDNVRNGLHMASLAGTWLACVAGFGGMRDHHGRITFAPRLPEQLDRMAFSLTFRGSRIHVEVHQHTATYHLRSGGPVELAHHGKEFTLAAYPVTKPIPSLRTDLPVVRQPFGRAPVRRGR